MALDRAKRQALIQQYADGPARLRAALAKVPPQALKWRPAPKEWSAHEVICHCADSETNAYARIRFLVAEKSPSLQGYDQDNWAMVFRATTAALIRGLPDEAWTRVGTHTESGRYGAEDWLATYADHLEIHSRQIENNVEQWKAKQSR